MPDFDGAREKRLLLVCSDFPPLIGTNTQRIQSYVRYLGMFGWHSSVVTREIADLPQIDSRDLQRIPESVEVIRIPDPDPFASRARRLGVYPADSAALCNSSSPAPALSKHPIVSCGSRSRPLQWLFSAGSGFLKVALRSLAYQPDALRLWANRVAADVCKEHSSDKDVLLTSSPAFSCHLAGLAIKQRTGLPWVADFRDLWVGRPFRELPSSLHTWWDKRLEARVVHGCDRLVVASPAWEQMFKRRYGDSVKGKLVTITNGYEADVIDAARKELAVKPASNDGKIRFVLTGSMHRGESPIPFIRALGIIKKSNPELAARALVTLIGNGGEHVDEIAAEISAGNLDHQVELLGSRSNVECIRAQFEANYLLLFSASEHVDTIRGKSFEYMATGKTILACIPENGVQAGILRQAGTAIIVAHDDVASIVRHLKRLLNDSVVEYTPNWEYINTFDRRRLTERLVSLLDELYIPDRS